MDDFKVGDRVKINNLGSSFYKENGQIVKVDKNDWFAVHIEFTGITWFKRREIVKA